MKMLFLITALCEGVTPQLKNELLVYLTDVLDLILKEVGGKRGDQNGAASSDLKIIIPVSTLWRGSAFVSNSRRKTVFKLCVPVSPQGMRLMWSPSFGIVIRGMHMC
jgi:hypothetical protein